MRIVYAPKFEKILVKLNKNDRRTFDMIASEMEKIIRAPEIGKPLRYTLKNRRRVRIGSYAIVYEFHSEELRFIDFDHHDRIYKK